MTGKLSDQMSYPPRGMDIDRAAAYVGVGRTKFLEMVAQGRMPQPVRIEPEMPRWDRFDLDAAFDDLKAKREDPLEREREAIRARTREINAQFRARRVVDMGEGELTAYIDECRRTRDQDRKARGRVLPDDKVRGIDPALLTSPMVSTLDALSDGWCKYPIEIGNPKPQTLSALETRGLVSVHGADWQITPAGLATLKRRAPAASE